MIEITLVRHGKTLGNTQGRYIGARTDEGLCQEGIEELKKESCPFAQLVYISPMRRCEESARLLYPGAELRKEPLLRECDFGLFENKNYKELSGEPKYQEWLDSGGTLSFPGGENPGSFRERCCRGFVRCVEEGIGQGKKSLAFVIHGGTIMSILWGFASPRGEYFKWQIKNGERYDLLLEEKLWQEEKLLFSVKKGTERG